MANPLPAPDERTGPAPVPEAARAVHVAPDARHYWAAERTLLAWVRTSIATMAFGFVVARAGIAMRVLGVETATSDSRGSMAIGAVLVLVGVAMNVLASQRFLRERRALSSGDASVASAAGPVSIAILLAVLGLVLVVAIVLVRGPAA